MDIFDLPLSSQICHVILFPLPECCQVSWGRFMFVFLLSKFIFQHFMLDFVRYKNCNKRPCLDYITFWDSNEWFIISRRSLKIFIVSCVKNAGSGLRLFIEIFSHFVFEIRKTFLVFNVEDEDMKTVVK